MSGHAHLLHLPPNILSQVKVVQPPCSPVARAGSAADWPGRAEQSYPLSFGLICSTTIVSLWHFPKEEVVERMEDGALLGQRSHRAGGPPSPANAATS